MGADGSPGSGRALRLDPTALPAHYMAQDGSADGQIRNIELDRDRVVLRRAVRGIAMKVGVPVNEFRGVVLRILPPQNDQPAMVAVMLEHRDDALNIPLYMATEDGSEAVAEWKIWGRVLGVPLLVPDDDGALREMFAPIDPAGAARSTARRLRRGAIRWRRPARAMRRKTGKLSPTANVYRGERELIARD
jgi:Family of unknown function (DUF6101)